MNKPILPTVLLTILLFVNAVMFGQAPPYTWAKSAGEAVSEQGLSIATDVWGNVYATGSFRSDTIVFGTHMLVNAATDGSADIFVVAYTPDGSVIWAKSFGGNQDDIAVAISADSLGNVIITGAFVSHVLDFGPGGVLTNSSSSGSQSDYFVAKLTIGIGSVLWAKGATGTASDGGSAITADGAGNIYVTGFFYSPSISFGSQTVNNTDAAGFTQDVFTVKYDNTGASLWAREGGSTGDDAGS